MNFSSNDSTRPNSNLPTLSSQSSSPCSSLSSSCTSLRAANSSARLEAANADIYNEIIKNAGRIRMNDDYVLTSKDDLEKVCHLGEGTSGQVYKMRHKSTGFEMAVKVRLFKSK